MRCYRLDCTTCYSTLELVELEIVYSERLLVANALPWTLSTAIEFRDVPKAPHVWSLSSVAFSGQLRSGDAV